MKTELSSTNDAEELSLKTEGKLEDADLPVINDSAVEAELETSTDVGELLIDADGSETLLLDTIETDSLSVGETPDTDDKEELVILDSLLEENKRVDSDDTRELGKSEDRDAVPANPDVSESMFD